MTITKTTGAIVLACLTAAVVSFAVIPASFQVTQASAKSSSTKGGYSAGPTSNNRKEIAEIIYNTGVKLGANDKAILAAFEAALVDSDMRNLNYGDADSVGVFQQRPSVGWGKRKKLLNVTYAAKAFFKGNPSYKNPKGAIFYAKKDGLRAHEVAQKVQLSAFPDRYQAAKQEAANWIRNIKG